MGAQLIGSGLVNVGTWIARAAQRYGNKLAIRSDTRDLTYPELVDRVARLGQGLKAAGLSRGDRLAFLLPNGHEMIEGVFACSAVGAIAVPLNWRFSAAELVKVVEDCAPSGLVYDPLFAETVAELVPALGGGTEALSLATGGDESSYESFLAAYATDDPVDPTVGGDDVHLLLYTSGTTGRPKGVMLTHANTFWQTVNGWSLGATPDVVSLVVLPLFHAGGINGSVTPVLHIGGTVLLPRTFDSGETLRVIERERVTGMVSVPTVFQMLADHPDFETTDLSSLLALISGGAALPPDLVERYHRRGIELRQGYGLTETAPGATGMGPGEALEHRGTVGRACLYVDVHIAGPSDEPLEVGEVGEILIRGPNVMKGYWNRPQETEAALRGGWFHTGDLGRLDDAGYLTIVGRKKEMIISGGENIDPREIEDLLSSHPAVSEAAVVGAPDPKWGEVPVAFVVLAEPAEPAELVRYCRDAIAHYKVPRDVVVVKELPKGELGKVKKSLLVARAADRRGGTEE